MYGTQNEQLTNIREAIGRTFDLPELRSLAYDLGVDLENFEGGKKAKIQGLIEHLERHGRIPDLINKLIDLRPTEDWQTEPGQFPATSPYKGLQYFTEADQHLFFGREQLTAQLLDRLQNERFLVVVGASGSGKSSVVRAGLVPAVRRGDIEIDGYSSREWPIHIVTPTDQPFKTLAVSLNPDIESLDKAQLLAEKLSQNSEILDLFLRQQTADQRHQRLLLVVDQFEELFTLCHDRDQRRLFIDNLVNAVQSGKHGRLKLILTLRADFYAHAVEYESLQPLLETGQQIVRAMSQDELREAIEKPAQEERWRFQPGLVEQILDDVGSEPGALPLLSHALQETWNRRENRTMTLNGYQQAGGVKGAIAKTAEAVYANLPPDQQTLARTIFLRLTELGEGTEDTRRRVWQTELIRRPEEQETITALIQTLANARLITTDTIQDQNGERREVVEVSHEALIREWPALRTWLNENRDWLRLHRRLTQDTKEWLASERDISLLYRGGKLAQVQEQTAERIEELNENERAFIEAGGREEERITAEREAQHQRELEAAQELAEARQNELEAQERKTTAVRRAVAGLSVLLVIAIMATIFAISAGRQATIDAENAATSEANAQAAATQAVSARGTAEAEAIRADTNLAAAQTAEAVAVTEAANALESAELAAEQEAEALAQAQIVRSQALAVISQSIADQDPMEALLLAIAAGKTAESRVTLMALNQQLDRTMRPIRTIGWDVRVLGAYWIEDGNRILTWGCGKFNGGFLECDSGNVQIWDVATGNILLNIPQVSLVKGASWIKERNQILTWARDNKVRLWNATSGELVLSLEHRLVEGVEWIEEGNRILTWGIDDTVRIWDAVSGELLQLVIHERLMFGATWIESGNRILTWGCGSLDYTRSIISNCLSGTVRLWDAASTDLLLTLDHDRSVKGATWIKERNQILTWARDDKVRLWNATSGALVLSLEHRLVEGVEWIEEGNRILTWGIDDTVRIWDTVSGELLMVLDHDGSVKGATWIEEKNSILTWSSDGTVRLWNADSGNQLLTLNTQGLVWGSTWIEEEDQILIWGCKYFNQDFWDCESGLTQIWGMFPSVPVLTLTHGSSIGGLEWIEEENQILSWSSDGKVRLWEPGLGNRLLTLNQDGLIYGVFWIKERNRIISWGIDETVWVWNATSGDLLITLNHEDSVRGAAWVEKEDRILTWSNDDTARLWDVTSGDLLITLNHEGSVRGATWIEVGNRILTWSYDGTAQLWDGASGDLLLAMNHEGSVMGATWIKEGDRILSWSADDTARLWDVTSGDLLITLNHEGSVIGAAWIDVGNYILTWGNDGAWLWDSFTGEKLISLIDSVNGEVIGQPIEDGSQFLFGTNFGDVQVYYISTQALAEYACQYTTRNFTWEEWQLYFPGQSYERTCPQWPVHPSVPQSTQ